MRLLAPSGSLCGVLRGVESPVCVLGCLRRENQRGARTAWFPFAFGTRGVARFCGGAILLLSWLCPWLVARLQGRVFLPSRL